MIPAIIGALGALGASAVSAWGIHRANKANAEMARNQMSFQERMSGTSYQRGMEDMRLAGLNPMLAYSQGGASSPGGSMSSFTNEAPDLSDVTSSAFSALTKKATLDNLKESNLKIRADANLSNAMATDASQRARISKLEADLAEAIGITPGNATAIARGTRAAVGTAKGAWDWFRAGPRVGMTTSKLLKKVKARKPGPSAPRFYDSSNHTRGVDYGY